MIFKTIILLIFFIGLIALFRFFETTPKWRNSPKGLPPDDLPPGTRDDYRGDPTRTK